MSHAQASPSYLRRLQHRQRARHGGKRLVCLLPTQGEPVRRGGGRGARLQGGRGDGVGGGRMEGVAGSGDRLRRWEEDRQTERERWRRGETMVKKPSSGGRLEENRPTTWRLGLSGRSEMQTGGEQKDNAWKG